MTYTSKNVGVLRGLHTVGHGIGAQLGADSDPAAFKQLLASLLLAHAVPHHAAPSPALALVSSYRGAFSIEK